MTTNSASKFAHHLFSANNLSDWTINYNRSRTSYGCCDSEKKTIILSRYFIERCTKKELKVVLLHEIAHALVPDEYHGKKWAAKCVELGIEPDVKLKLCDLPSLYIAYCVQCHTKYTRNRSTKRNLYCRYCGCKNELKWAKQ